MMRCSIRDGLTRKAVWVTEADTLTRASRESIARGGDPEGVDPAGAHLGRADLHKPELSGATVLTADPSEADFVCARVAAAKVSAAGLSDANLLPPKSPGLSLRVADRCGAKVSQREGLSTAQRGSQHTVR